MMAKPTVREYLTEQEVIGAVQDLESKGISQKDIYVLAHQDDRTNQVADRANVNTIGIKEEGLSTAVKNVFNSKGDELRNKMEEMGLSQYEAEEYERKLDEGKILLFVKE
ncbi:general stress protein [Fictibacillus sp. Mic-4]|uniref:general stress protein n=1 Tax=Fictibacillus sp. Mic-4 TaxID=3132826 RepID=UPI003CE999C3